MDSNSLNRMLQSSTDAASPEPHATFKKQVRANSLPTLAPALVGSKAMVNTALPAGAITPLNGAVGGVMLNSAAPLPERAPKGEGSVSTRSRSPVFSAKSDERVDEITISKLD